MKHSAEHISTGQVYMTVYDCVWAWLCMTVYVLCMTVWGSVVVGVIVYGGVCVGVWGWECERYDSEVGGVWVCLVTLV